MKDGASSRPKAHSDSKSGTGKTAERYNVAVPRVTGNLQVSTRGSLWSQPLTDRAVSAETISHASASSFILRVETDRMAHQLKISVCDIGSVPLGLSRWRAKTVIEDGGEGIGHLLVAVGMGDIHAANRGNNALVRTRSEMPGTANVSMRKQRPLSRQSQHHSGAHATRSAPHGFKQSPQHLQTLVGTGNETIVLGIRT